MRQWTMVRMPDRVMFWQFHQQPDGTFDAPESIVIPLDPSRPRWHYVDVQADATRIDGLPRAESTRVSFTRPDGGIDRYELTPVGWPAYLQGGGYHDGYSDRLGRGVFRGFGMRRYFYRRGGCCMFGHERSPGLLARVHRHERS